MVLVFLLVDIFLVSNPRGGCRSRGLLECFGGWDEGGWHHYTRPGKGFDSRNVFPLYIPDQYYINVMLRYLVAGTDQFPVSFVHLFLP